MLKVIVITKYELKLIVMDRSLFFAELSKQNSLGNLSGNSYTTKFKEAFFLQIRRLKHQNWVFLDILIKFLLI